MAKNLVDLSIDAEPYEHASGPAAIHDEARARARLDRSAMGVGGRIATGDLVAAAASRQLRCRLDALAQACGLELAAREPSTGAATDASGLFPGQFDRALEERLFALCVSGDVDPAHWRALGPSFFVAGRSGVSPDRGWRAPLGSNEDQATRPRQIAGATDLRSVAMSSPPSTLPSPAPAFLPATLPTLREASVFGRRICYYDLGQGPPLVLVHGIGGDADQWAFCFGALAASHRVIAFDLLGFGRSDKPLIDYRIEVYVEVLERFLAALALERASLLGHSLGGWIVAAFALQFPGKVDKLVLCDAAGIDAGAVELTLDLNVSSRRHMREVLEFMFHDRRMVSDGLVDLAYALHLERNDGYTIRSVLATLADPREKLDGKLGSLRAPTLLLWGEEDAVTPLAMARVWQRLIDGAMLKVIPQCGHLPPLEKPAEFARAVTDFLRT